MFYSNKGEVKKVFIFLNRKSKKKLKTFKHSKAFCHNGAIPEK